MLKSSASLGSLPKCPLNITARLACISENCSFSPFICRMEGECKCKNGHKMCKIMQWSSIINLLDKYEDCIGEGLKFYIKKVEKLYDDLISKAQTELKAWRESLEIKVFGLRFSEIKEKIKYEKYGQISSSDLRVVETIASTSFDHNEISKIHKFNAKEIKDINDSFDANFKTIYNLCNDKLESILMQIKFKAQENTQKVHTKMTRSSSVPRSPFYSSNQFIYQEIESPTKLGASFPKSIGSKILSGTSVLNKLMKYKVKKYLLIYRASENEYSIQEFYRKMGKHEFSKLNEGLSKPNEGNLTLILAKTEFGRIVGGYTKLKWEQIKNSHFEDDSDSSSQANAKESKYKHDFKGSSTLFSIDSNQMYPLVDPIHAIYCGRKSIGFGLNDLRIVNKSEKNGKNFIMFPCSYCEVNCSKGGKTKKLVNTLSGSHDSKKFKITEWEAFEVVVDFGYLNLM